MIVFVLPLLAVAPGEWIFLASDADPRWQDAIGIFYTQHTSLVLYDTTTSIRKVVFNSHDPSDGQDCPMSAFGYYDCRMRRAFRSYPVVSSCDSFVKIVYNVNDGECGWLQISDKTEIIMLSDTNAFRGMDVVYLSAVGAENYRIVAYRDKPDGGVIEYDTIPPFNPPAFQDRIKSESSELPQKTYEDMISVRGYSWKELSLGTVTKIDGDWAQLGSWDYEELVLRPADRWIRIRDKQEKLLVWFVRVLLD